MAVTASQSIFRWKTAAWGAVVTAATGLFFLFTRAGDGLAHLSYDLLFAFRSEVQPREAVIIAMDDGAHAALGQSFNAPWDRAVHARLLRHLAACRAKAVVFDIWFDEPGANVAEFLAAVAEARRAGVPVLVGATFDEAGRGGKFSGRQTQEPFDALKELADWGWAEQGEEEEGLRRHFAGAADHRGDWKPSLAWRAAELTLPPPLPEATRTRWIRYYGPPGAIARRSFHEAFETNLVPASVFAGQVCFVGAVPPKTPPSGGLRVDAWRTPFTRWRHVKTPGVEITATVYLNLARNDWLRRLPVWREAALLLAAATLLGGLTMTRPAWALGGGLLAGAAALAVTCWLVAAWSAWFPWLLVAGVQAPVAIVWSLLAQTKRLAREKAALESQLAAATPVLSPVPPAPSPVSPTRHDAVAAAAVPSLLERAAPDRRPLVPDHELLRRVGKGAYGEVWLARNAIGTFHAVKIVRREDFEEARPFEREFRGLQKFMPISREHPGLVQILHVGRNDGDGFFYYVMQAADDETTGQQINPEAYTPKNLAREIKRRGHLPLAECLALALDLAAALDFLHQHGLIHRDIKPANIIFVRGTPKLADIGLVTDVATTERAVSLLGTIGYIPPEGPGTPSADVFSLGKVLYEAGMGLPAGSFPELPLDLPQRADSTALFQFNQVLLKACHETASERYPTATALREALLELQRRLREGGFTGKGSNHNAI